jgi:hypothetical protein
MSGQGRTYASIFTPIQGAGSIMLLPAGAGDIVQEYMQLDDTAGPVAITSFTGGSVGDRMILSLVDGGNGATIAPHASILLPDATTVRLRTTNESLTFIKTTATTWTLVSQGLLGTSDVPHPVWLLRTRLTAASISGAGVTDTVNIAAALPPGADVFHAFVNVAASATFGGTTTGLNAQVGIAGAVAGYRGNVALQTAPGRLYGAIGVGADVSDGATAVIATFTAAGGPGVIDEVLTGRWDFYVYFTITPNIA